MEESRDFDRALANLLTRRAALADALLDLSRTDEAGFLDNRHRDFYLAQIGIGKELVGALNQAAEAFLALERRLSRSR